MSAPCAARADSIAWGGTVGRLQVHMSRLGFNDGFGVGGWQPEDAKQFAAWARALSAVLPPGAGLEIHGAEGEPLQLTLKRCRPADTTCERPLASAVVQTDLQGDPADPRVAEQVLGVLARALGAPLPRPRSAQGATAAAVYSIEVFSSADERRAETYARQLDAREIPVPHQMYYAACGPCRIPEAHVVPVEDREGSKTYRVLVGNFENRAAAQRARAALGRAGLRGVVRPL